MTHEERQALIYARFRSIPPEHALGVTIIKGATWAGAGYASGEHAGTFIDKFINQAGRYSGGTRDDG